MYTTRRTVLRQLGTGLIGMNLLPLEKLAASPSAAMRGLLAGDVPIRLSSNENPYGPSPMATKAMAEAIAKSNRYNWNTTGDLITALAQKNQVSDENILLGAGSTAILNSLVQSFALQKGTFIVADPSYTNWTKTAENLGLKKVTVPLTSDKQHNLAGMLAAITPDTRFLYICNPNNPTGTVCEKSELIAFIREATKEITVFVDEAYIDFSGQVSVAPLALENKNLVVVRTFSKIYGLAGARIGYAIAHQETIEQVSRMQSWANGDVSLVSRAAAIASLDDHDFVKACYAKNETVRKYTMEQLTQLKIMCIPSHTNFIYFSLEKYEKDFFALLKSNNIQGTGMYEQAGKWTRITVGTMEEMQKFIAAVR
jgi:histidinol-phosphate aminotransferase